LGKGTFAEASGRTYFLAIMSVPPPAWPTWFDWLTVLAIVAGPCLALFIQRKLDIEREKKAQRQQLYLNLMSSRGTMLAADHVRALNSIEIVFSEKSDSKIRDAWRKLMALVLTDMKQPGWFDRYQDLKADLFREIGLTIGYDFSTDDLKRHVYAPSEHGDIQSDLSLIRKALAKALTEDGLRVRLAEPPTPESK
jgi:hypothetical protein